MLAKSSLLTQYHFKHSIVYFCKVCILVVRVGLTSNMTHGMIFTNSQLLLLVVKLTLHHCDICVIIIYINKHYKYGFCMKVTFTESLTVS